MPKSETKPKVATKTESQTYQSMLNELDEIVRSVSQGKMDLDEIVGKIEHGYELIATMRQRLDQTKAKVEKLRVDFEKNTSTGVSAHNKTPEKTSCETASDDTDDDDLPF